MRSASELILEDPETETVGRCAASIASASDLAEEYLLGAGRGASPAEVDGAIEQIRRAVEAMNHLQRRLEALQWDMESEEMDAELRQRGYVADGSRQVDVSCRRERSVSASGVVAGGRGEAPQNFRGDRLSDSD